MKRANAIHIVLPDQQNLQKQQEETLNKIPFSNTDRYSPKPINYNTMDMKPNWREKYVYPIAGLATIAIILYFTVSDYQFEFELPTVLWQNKMNFVGVNSTRFVVLDDDHLVVNGRKGKEQQKQSGIYFNGWNSYWLMEKSVWEPSRSKVSEMLKRGAQMGMNVCRVWAFNDGPGANSVQISPGVFNERALKGLDFVIVEARKHGVRLILSLVNNLNVYGGKEQYVKWAQEAGLNVSSSDDSFFSEPVIKEYYKAYIKAIITRRNSRSGVRYSDEPAIFAWELINEPRCDSDPSSCMLQAWITEMASYVKSLDQNHLVTIGLEGFYGPKAVDRSAVNPGDWAASLGTDFLQNSAVEGIDFASVHAYPDSWLPHANATEKLNFIIRWVDSHISDAEYILKKPVLFTEVGCPLHGEAQGFYNRDTVLRVVYDRISESAKKGQAGSGALIWQLLVEGMEEYGDRFSLVAWENPSTYKLMVQQSCRLKSAYSESKSDVKRNEKDLCSGLVPQLRP